MKLRRKFIATVLFVLCLTSANSAFAYTYKVLPITNFDQEKSNWCWVAGGKSIIQYEKGKTYTQCLIYQWGENVYSCEGNKEGNMWTHFSNMFYKAGFSHTGTVTSSAISFNSVKSQIDNYNGIIARRAWLSGGGHIAIIRGYDTTGTKVYWTDIKEVGKTGDRYRTTSYDWFRYSSKNGSWNWSHTRSGQTS